MNPASIFISYRRSTNAAFAGRLHDNLVRHFGDDEVFLDVDTIAPGRDFVEELNERVSQCSIFLLVIGPNWLKLENDDGTPRLFDPNDYVHIELKRALARGIHVIPVLVDGAKLPSEDKLPDDLKPLATRQAVELSHDRFVDEVNALAATLQGYLIEKEPQRLKAYELFFALKGRIARKEYWKAIVVLYSFSLFCGLLLLIITASVFYSETDDVEMSLEKAGQISQFDDIGSRILLLIMSLPLIYVNTAIYSKRLHDLNLGFKTLISLICFGGFIFILFTFKVISEHDFNLATVFSIGIMALIGLIPGTKGPNAYGPDPLGRRQDVS